LLGVFVYHVVTVVTLVSVGQLARCLSVAGCYRGGSPTAIQAWQPCPLGAVP